MGWGCVASRLLPSISVRTSVELRTMQGLKLPLRGIQILMGCLVKDESGQI